MQRYRPCGGDKLRVVNVCRTRWVTQHRVLNNLCTMLRPNACIIYWVICKPYMISGKEASVMKHKLVNRGLILSVILQPAFPRTAVLYYIAKKAEIAYAFRFRDETIWTVLLEIPVCQRDVTQTAFHCH